MMKIKSQNLLAFLIKHDALDNPEKKLKYKKIFRREYQKEWASRKRKTLHEIRFNLEDKPYKALEKLCKKSNVSPSMLAKTLLIDRSQSKATIPNRQALVGLSADLGLLINQLLKQRDDGQDVNQKVINILLLLEERLLNYLKNSN